MSDRFGRRPVIIGAVGFYFTCSLGAAFAPDVEMLSLWRFLQGW
jgi:MFS family permease